MYQNDLNEYGCPLRDQTGSVGVRNFDAVVARLEPDLRAAFEAERAARRAELEHYLASGADASADFCASSDQAEPPSQTEVLITRREQLLGKLGRLWLRELIESRLSRIAPQQKVTAAPSLYPLYKSSKKIGAYSRNSWILYRNYLRTTRSRSHNRFENIRNRLGAFGKHCHACSRSIALEQPRQRGGDIAGWLQHCRAYRCRIE